MKDLSISQDTSMIAKPKYEDVIRRVSDRTVELARLAGRASHEIRQGDYERAKSEIAGARSTGGQ